jgi:3-hydroxyisobutyrate dehydrogenase
MGNDQHGDEMRVGLIGLGNLGRAMASRLASERTDLTVWNRTSSKAEGLNVRVASSPAALVSDVDVLFLNLFDSPAVREVLSGDNGVLKGACEGKVIIDTTTNHPDAVKSFHVDAANRGASYLEAPVIGSVLPASQGNLIMLVSGKRSAYDRALPYIRVLCKEIHFLDEPGQSTRMKLVNNFVLATFMAVLGEAVGLAELAGIEKKTVLEVLKNGGGNSGVLRVKEGNMLNDEYPSHFSGKAILKDLQYLEDLARELHRSLAFFGPSKDSYALAVKTGLGDADFSAVYKALKEGT